MTQLFGQMKMNLQDDSIPGLCPSLFVPIPFFIHFSSRYYNAFYYWRGKSKFDGGKVI